MKEMNSLETQLRSWRPRRPSAALKRRLFGTALAHSATWYLGRLAPAAACALLTVGLWGSRNGFPVGTPLPGLLASNVTATVFDGFANKENCWSSVTFDSTNRSGLDSIIGSLRH